MEQKAVDFASVKQKIIKTDELIRLYREAVDKSSQWQSICECLKNERKNNLKDIKRYELEQERLEDSLKRTRSRKTQLEEENKKLLNEKLILEEEFNKRIVREMTTTRDLQNELKFHEEMSSAAENLSNGKSKKSEESLNKSKEGKCNCQKNNSIQKLTLENKQLKEKIAEINKDHSDVIGQLQSQIETLQDSKTASLRYEEQLNNLQKEIGMVQLKNEKLQNQLNNAESKLQNTTDNQPKTKSVETQTILQEDVNPYKLSNVQNSLETVEKSAVLDHSIDESPHVFETNIGGDPFMSDTDEDESIGTLDVNGHKDVKMLGINAYEDLEEYNLEEILKEMTNCPIMLSPLPNNDNELDHKTDSFIQTQPSDVITPSLDSSKLMPEKPSQEIDKNIVEKESSPLPLHFQHTDTMPDQEITSNLQENLIPSKTEKVSNTEESPERINAILNKEAISNNDENVISEENSLPSPVSEKIDTILDKEVVKENGSCVENIDIKSLGEEEMKLRIIKRNRQSFKNKYLFKKTQYLRAMKAKKRQKTKSGSVLNALKILQKANIKFTISNESTLPSDWSNNDLLKQLFTTNQPLLKSKPPENNVESSLGIKPTTDLSTSDSLPETVVQIDNHQITEKLTCTSKNCENSYMILQKINKYTELLGFSFDSNNAPLAESKPNVTEDLSLVCNDYVKSQNIPDQLVDKLAELVSQKIKDNSKKRKRVESSTYDRDSLTSETEPEIERLFEMSDENILKRNKMLLKKAKYQYCESHSASSLESPIIQNSPREFQQPLVINKDTVLNSKEDSNLCDEDSNESFKIPFCPQILSPMSSVSSSPIKKTNLLYINESSKKENSELSLNDAIENSSANLDAGETETKATFSEFLESEHVEVNNEVQEKLMADFMKNPVASENTNNVSDILSNESVQSSPNSVDSGIESNLTQSDSTEDSCETVSKTSCTEINKNDDKIVDISDLNLKDHKAANAETENVTHLLLSDLQENNKNIDDLDLNIENEQHQLIPTKTEGTELVDQQALNEVTKNDIDLLSFDQPEADTNQSISHQTKETKPMNKQIEHEKRTNNVPLSPFNLQEINKIVGIMRAERNQHISNKNADMRCINQQTTNKATELIKQQTTSKVTKDVIALLSSDIQESRKYIDHLDLSIHDEQNQTIPHQTKGTEVMNKLNQNEGTNNVSWSSFNRQKASRINIDKKQNHHISNQIIDIGIVNRQTPNKVTQDVFNVLPPDLQDSNFIELDVKFLESNRETEEKYVINGISAYDILSMIPTAELKESDSELKDSDPTNESSHVDPNEDAKSPSFDISAETGKNDSLNCPLSPVLSDNETKGYEPKTIPLENESGLEIDYSEPKVHENNITNPELAVNILTKPSSQNVSVLRRSSRKSKKVTFDNFIEYDYASKREVNRRKIEKVPTQTIKDINKYTEITKTNEQDKTKIIDVCNSIGNNSKSCNTLLNEKSNQSTLAKKKPRPTTKLKTQILRQVRLKRRMFQSDGKINCDQNIQTEKINASSVTNPISSSIDITENNVSVNEKVTSDVVKDDCTLASSHLQSNKKITILQNIVIRTARSNITLANPSMTVKETINVTSNNGHKTVSKCTKSFSNKLENRETSDSCDVVSDIMKQMNRTTNIGPNNKPKIASISRVASNQGSTSTGPMNETNKSVNLVGRMKKRMQAISKKAKNCETTTNSNDVLSQILNEMDKDRPEPVLKNNTPKKSVPFSIDDKQWRNNLLDIAEITQNKADMETYFSNRASYDLNQKLNKWLRKKLPAKESVLLKKLFEQSNEGQISDEILTEFKRMGVNTTVNVILHRLSEDIYEKPDVSCCPAPLMTKTQRLFLSLMLKLEKEKLGNLLETFLKRVEILLFRHLHKKWIMPFTRLYLGVCRLQGNINRMRMFCCEAFFYMGDLAVPLFYIVLKSWIEVMPLESEQQNFPLAKVLVQIVHLKVCNIVGYNLQPLRKLLHQYHGFPIERWNCDEFFQELYEQYLKEPSHVSEFAICLFCHHKTTQWVNKKMNEIFKPLVYKIPVENVNFKASVILMMGKMVRCFKPNVAFDETCLMELERFFLGLTEADEVHNFIRDGVSLAIERLPKKKLNANIKKVKKTTAVNQKQKNMKSEKWKKKIISES